MRKVKINDVKVQVTYDDFTDYNGDIRVNTISFSFAVFCAFGFKPAYIFYLIGDVYSYHVNCISIVPVDVYSDFEISDEDYLEVVDYYHESNDGDLDLEDFRKFLSEV